MMLNETGVQIRQEEFRVKLEQKVFEAGQHKLLINVPFLFRNRL
jgi:hypothetical protein